MKPKMPKKIRIANERRAKLIHKKVYSKLTEEEKEEYAQVDKLVGDWINEHFPAPVLDVEQLNVKDEIKNALRKAIFERQRSMKK